MIYMIFFLIKKRHPKKGGTLQELQKYQGHKICNLYRWVLITTATWDNQKYLLETIGFLFTNFCKKTNAQ